MKIAIVGAGFSGIATAWFCLEHSAKVTLFEKKAIGAGASGVAAGLLHPFVGAKAHLNWNGTLALQDTLFLLEIASKALGVSVYKKTGMFRPATTEKQNKYFKKTAALYPELTAWQKPSFFDCTHEGLFIPDAYTVDCKAYLNGLWKACSERGAQLEIGTIDHIDALSSFDAVFFATGASHIQGCAFPPFEKVKGQLLEVAFDELLPFAINSSAYIAQFSQGSCILGATFERTWQDEQPDAKLADFHIRTSIASFSPKLAALPFHDCRAALRAMSPSSLPIIQQVHPKAWYIGAMGAKGLLYHAFFAKKCLHYFLHQIGC